MKFKHITWIICMTILFTAANLNAQVNSELIPDKLTFLEDGNPFVSAEYGLNSFSLIKDFNTLEYFPSTATLSVGSDLVWTTIGTEGVNVAQCCVIPSKQAELTINHLMITNDNLGLINSSELTYDDLVYDSPFGGFGANYGLEGLEIGTDFNLTTLNSIELTLGGSGIVHMNNSGIVNIENSSNLTNSEGILTSQSTTTPGTNSDAYGVHGKNDVDDWFGYGVVGEGGFQGVRGTVNPTGTNSSYAYYGVRGVVSGGTGINYAVYGSSSGTGINYAGYFSGDATVTGTFNNPSDIKLKRNIQDYDNALEKVMSLQAKTYEFQTERFSTMYLPETKQFGFIAQEVQSIFPELVKMNVHASTDKTAENIGYLGVNYIGLIPILTKAIQEQQSTIEEKENQITTLQNHVADLEKKFNKLEDLVSAMIADQELNDQEK